MEAFCDNTDAKVYADRIKLNLTRDGDRWCATRKDFVNLQTDPSGFGVTALDAMSELARALGFAPTKINWHNTFQDLVRK